MGSSLLCEARNMRADDIRPYTRTRKSMFKSSQRASRYEFPANADVGADIIRPRKLQPNSKGYPEKKNTFRTAFC